MDTKTIEQVNVLKADALSIIVLKEVKMIWHVFSGRAGMTDVMANGWISSLGRSYCILAYRG